MKLVRGRADARWLPARFNFGLGPEPTQADFNRIAHRYPVFRVDDRLREG